MVKQDEDLLFQMKRLYLLMGPACNTTCRHCRQEPVKDFMSCALRIENVDDSVYEFLKQLNAVFEKKRKICQLHFWGGEPLIHFQFIKDFVSKIKELGLMQIRFVIITNGLLLNEEMVVFFNRNPIQVDLSYDGPNPYAVRNQIINQDKIDLFLKINDRLVGFVWNAINDNFVETMEYLVRIFPETFLHPINITEIEPEPVDVYAFKKGRIEKAVKDCKDYLSYSHRSPMIERIIRRWFGRYFWRKQIYDENTYDNLYTPFCRTGFIVNQFDISGRVCLCHNLYRDTVGYLSEPIEVIQERILERFADCKPLGCKSCEYLPWCHGDCICACLTEDKQERMQCKYFKVLFKSIIENFKEDDVIIASEIKHSPLIIKKNK